MFSDICILTSASHPKAPKLKNDDKDNDIPAPAESYQYCYEMWIQSSHHGTVLHSQWEHLLARSLKEDTFNLSGVHVIGIYKICKVFKANSNVRFRAVELFDRFLKLFSRDMAPYLMKCNPKEVDEFRVRFESQVLLRMCSCLLIASKLHNDQQVCAITTGKIKKFLKAEGFIFSNQNIVSSEFRILDMLMYRCHWPMPLDLVEQLLCLLNLKIGHFRRAHYFGILLLDFFYADAESINERFRLKKKDTITSMTKRINSPLQAAAIVLVALYFVAAETKSTFNLEIGSVIAHVARVLPERDVYELASTMLDILKI